MKRELRDVRPSVGFPTHFRDIPEDPGHMGAIRWDDPMDDVTEGAPELRVIDGRKTA